MNEQQAEQLAQELAQHPSVKEARALPATEVWWEHEYDPASWLVEIRVRFHGFTDHDVMASREEWDAYYLKWGAKMKGKNEP
jgi:hypothetical protein